MKLPIIVIVGCSLKVLTWLLPAYHWTAGALEMPDVNLIEVARRAGAEHGVLALIAHAALFTADVAAVVLVLRWRTPWVYRGVAVWALFSAVVELMYPRPQFLEENAYFPWVVWFACALMVVGLFIRRTDRPRRPLTPGN